MSRINLFSLWTVLLRSKRLRVLNQMKMKRKRVCSASTKEMCKRTTAFCWFESLGVEEGSEVKELSYSDRTPKPTRTKARLQNAWNLSTWREDTNLLAGWEKSQLKNALQGSKSSNQWNEARNAKLMIKTIWGSFSERQWIHSAVGCLSELKTWKLRTGHLQAKGSTVCLRPLLSRNWECWRKRLRLQTWVRKGFESHLAI